MSKNSSLVILFVAGLIGTIISAIFLSETVAITVISCAFGVTVLQLLFGS